MQPGKFVVNCKYGDSYVDENHRYCPSIGGALGDKQAGRELVGISIPSGGILLAGYPLSGLGGYLRGTLEPGTKNSLRIYDERLLSACFRPGISIS